MYLQNLELTAELCISLFDVTESTDNLFTWHWLLILQQVPVRRETLIPVSISHILSSIVFLLEVQNTIAISDSTLFQDILLKHMFLPSLIYNTKLRFMSSKYDL